MRRATTCLLVLAVAARAAPAADADPRQPLGATAVAPGADRVTPAPSTIRSPSNCHGTTARTIA